LTERPWSPAVLVRLLGRVYLSRASGLLTLASDHGWRQAAFREGRLAEVLLHPSAGFSVVAPRSEVEQQLFETVAALEGPRRRRQPERALFGRTALLDALGWAQAHFDWLVRPVERPKSEDDAPELPLEPFILDALPRLTNPEDVRDALGERDVVLVPSRVGDVVELPLNPYDAFVLERVDGTSTLEDLVRRLPLDPAETERSVLGLLCLGLLRPRAVTESGRLAAVFPALAARRERIQQVRARLASPSHFEFLGLTPAATSEDVHTAHRRLLKQLHPEANRHPDLADLQPVLRTILRRLDEALHALTEPDARTRHERFLTQLRQAAGPGVVAQTSPPPPPATPTPTPTPAPALPPLNPIAVENALVEARRLLRTRRPAEAVQTLEPLAGRITAPRLAERVRLLLARAHLVDPHGTRLAEKVLLETIERNPRSGEAHTLLASVYRVAGLHARAQALLRRALELDPGNAHALALQAELESEARRR
jgi:tetratricopeptide (TPR) repeat protein